MASTMLPRSALSSLLVSALVSRSAALLVAAWAGTGAASAQTLVTPSSHWGALLYPEFEPMAQFGLHLDRFTEFDKKKDAAGNPILTSYNGLKETIGFNAIAISITGKFVRSPATLYRVTIHGGYSADEPTRFLQNEVIHAPAGLDPVPVAETRSAWDGGVSLDVHHWVAGPLRVPLFAGAGVAFATINSDAFVQAGFRAAHWGPSAVVRVGGVSGGDALPSEVLSSRYLTAQASFRLPLDDWLAGLWGLMPELELGTTYTTGLFADTTGVAISEKFVTLKVAWGPLTIETWNDAWASDKDQGPTYGLKVSVRSAAFAASRWLH
jgi:hypothetical protein